MTQQLTPWRKAPTLTTDLADSPAQRLRRVPPEALQKGRTLLDAMIAEAPPGVRRYAQLLRLRTANRFHSEAVSLARLLEVDWRWVFLANLSYDLVISAYGCSTVALATKSGPVLARNMDWWPEHVLAQTSYLLRYEREGQFVFANAGWPGAIGMVSGLSARGFGIVLNAVASAKPFSRLGYPVLLHIRRVVEDAADFDKAVRMLCNERLMSSCLLTVVGMKNDQRVVIERTATAAASRRPRGDEPLVATNHFCGMKVPAPEPYCPRFEALSSCFDASSAARDVSTPELLYTLQREDIMQQITAQHVIMRPAAGEIELYVPSRLLIDDGDL